MKRLLLLCCCLPLWAMETYNLNNWEEHPFAGGLCQAGERMVVFDPFDGKVRAYHVGAGYERPPLLWSGPGFGQGPGQIQSTSPNLLKSISLDPETGHCWVSHAFGWLVFDTNGALIHENKIPYQAAVILPVPGGVIRTGADPLTQRSIAALYTLEDDEPRWTLDHPNPELPMNETGAFLMPYLELFRLGNDLYSLDGNIGELIRFTKSGEILWIKMLPIHRIELLRLGGYGPYIRGERHSETSAINGRSGMVQVDRHPGELLLLTPWLADKMPTKKHGVLDPILPEPVSFKLLTRVDPLTGEVLGRYVHPQLSTRLIALAAARGNRLLLWDQGDGESLFQADLSEFMEVALPHP